MEALVAIAVGLALLKLLPSPQGQQTQSEGPPPPKRDSSIDALNTVKTLGTGVATVTGATLGGVVGGAVYVAANAGLGALITGDPLGALGGLYGTPIGGTFVSTGNVGNVGRVIGREIDRLLGGSGGGATGVTYQAAGYLGALAIASGGLLVLPGVGLLFGLIVGIGSAISDSSRLAYGQKGVREDMRKEAQAKFSGFYSTLLAAAHDGWKASHRGADFDDSSDDFRLRFNVTVAHYLWGFLIEESDTRRRMHMAPVRPRGVGSSEAYHEKWGRDRGLWLADRSEVTWHIAASPEVFMQMPSGPAIGPPVWASNHDSLDDKIVELAGGQAIWNQVRAESPAEMAFAVESGKAAANVEHYLGSMRETWGAFQSPGSHANYWKNQEGRFLGEVLLPSGNLSFSGLTVDWSKALAASDSVGLSNAVTGEFSGRF